MRATVRSRSRPFAQACCLQRFPYKRANATEPERTPNLAILATARASTRVRPAPRCAARRRGRRKAGGSSHSRAGRCSSAPLPQPLGCRRCSRIFRERLCLAVGCSGVAPRTCSNGVMLTIPFQTRIASSQARPERSLLACRFTTQPALPRTPKRCALPEPSRGSWPAARCAPRRAWRPCRLPGRASS
jgi:hypothetical protein